MSFELVPAAPALVPAAPAPVLRGIAIEYRGFRDDASSPPAQREYPSASVPVIIDCGAGWHVATPASGYRTVRISGFVAGIHDAFALVRSLGPALGVQVDLAPLGARRLLQLPMHEIVNRVVPVEDLPDRGARSLAERLADAPGWPERFAIIDAVLARRAAEAPAVSPGVAWGWGRLQATAGRCRSASSGRSWAGAGSSLSRGFGRRSV